MLDTMDPVNGESYDGDDYCAAVGNRAPASSMPWVNAPSDPQGGFSANPAFSMIRTMDNGAVAYSDGSADQRVSG